MRARWFISSCAFVLLAAMVACETFADPAFAHRIEKLELAADVAEGRIELSESQLTALEEKQAAVGLSDEEKGELARLKNEQADAQSDLVALSMALKEIKELQEEAGGLGIGIEGLNLTELIVIMLGGDRLVGLFGVGKKVLRDRSQKKLEEAARIQARAMAEAGIPNQSGGGGVAMS